MLMAMKIKIYILALKIEKNYIFLYLSRLLCISCINFLYMMCYCKFIKHDMQV